MLRLAIFFISIASYCNFCLSNDELMFEDGHEWSYNGAMLDPNHWFVKYEACGGHHQSPIEIDVPNIILGENLGFLNMHGYSSPLRNVTLRNDGHSIKIEVPTDYADFSANRLPGVYRLRQFHFHWGSKDVIGSEHEVNTKRYPLELHFVHSLSNVPEDKIMQTPNSLVVLCVFFETRDEDNPNIQDLINNISEVKNETFKQINMKRVDELFPKDLSSYITYNGSLTTPPCNEVVDWIIFTRVNYLSHRQMEEFRRMKHYFVYHIGNRTKRVEEMLIDNDRPLQNLYDRVIRLRGDLGDLVPPLPPPPTPPSSGQHPVSSLTVFLFAFVLIKLVTL